MKNTYLLFLLVGLLLLLVIVFLYFRTGADKGREINNFLECEAAGYPVMESYPRQCRTPDGRNFIEVLPTATEQVNMANPASVYCVEQGGVLDIREESEGQVGYCTLPGGFVCEEWEYFRGECPAVNTSPTSSVTPAGQ